MDSKGFIQIYGFYYSLLLNKDLTEKQLNAEVFNRIFKSKNKNQNPDVKQSNKELIESKIPTTVTNDFEVIKDSFDKNLLEICGQKDFIPITHIITEQ